MADLKLALPTIFLHEGRYVNNSSDPGSATNFGISLRFLMSTGDLDHDGWLDGDIDRDGDVDIDDIKKMSEEDAARLYELYFWNKYGYEQISSQSVATKIFDLCVNMGPIGAHKCAQRAVRSVSGSILVEDGILGNKSLSSIDNLDVFQYLSALKSEAAGHYRNVRLKSGNEKEFINGWLNRAYSNMVMI